MFEKSSNFFSKNEGTERRDSPSSCVFLFPFKDPPRRNARENNSKKCKQGQVTVHDTIGNDERPKKKSKYTLRSHT